MTKDPEDPDVPDDEAAPERTSSDGRTRTHDGTTSPRAATDDATGPDVGPADGGPDVGPADGGTDVGAAEPEANDGSTLDAVRQVDVGEPVDVDRYAVSAECSHEELLAAAKVYARAVVARHGLTVDVTGLDWEVSIRAKRRAGAVRYRDGDPESVALTWAHFANQGWSATAATVRHELVHVHLLNEAGDPSHGPAFERLADLLDAPVNCERFAPPKYWVTCRDCGQRLARYRRSKVVEHPDRYECGACGGRLTAERNTDDGGGTD